MESFLILLTAFLFGVFVDALYENLKKPYGTLRIDHSDPDKDVYQFRIDNFDDLSKKKRITLRVDNNADLSQK